MRFSAVSAMLTTAVLATASCATTPPSDASPPDRTIGDADRGAIPEFGNIIAELDNVSVIEITENPDYLFGPGITGEMLYGKITTDFRGLSTGNACPETGFLGSLRRIVVSEKRTAGAHLTVIEKNFPNRTLVVLPLFSLTYDEDPNECSITVNTGGGSSPMFPIPTNDFQIEVKLNFWQSEGRNTSIARKIADYGSIVSNNLLANIAGNRIDAFTNDFLDGLETDDDTTVTRDLAFTADARAKGLRVDLGETAGLSDSILIIKMETEPTLFNIGGRPDPRQPFEPSTFPSPDTAMSLVLSQDPLVRMQDIVTDAFAEGDITYNSWTALLQEDNPGAFQRGCNRIRQAIRTVGLTDADRAVVLAAIYDDSSFNKDKNDYYACFGSRRVEQIARLAGADRAPRPPAPPDPPVIDPPVTADWPSDEQRRRLVSGDIRAMFKADRFDAPIHAENALGSDQTLYQDINGLIFETSASTESADRIPVSALIETRQRVEYFGCYLYYSENLDDDLEFNDRPRFEALGRVDQTQEDVWIRGYFDKVEPGGLARISELRVYNFIPTTTKDRYQTIHPQGCGAQGRIYKSSLIFDEFTAKRTLITEVEDETESLN